MGGTRVELVTPSVSSWCSNQTELAALFRAYLSRRAGRVSIRAEKAPAYRIVKSPVWMNWKFDVPTTSTRVRKETPLENLWTV